MGNVFQIYQFKQIPEAYTKVGPETQDFWWNPRRETRHPPHGSVPGRETRNPKGGTQDLRSRALIIHGTRDPRH